MTKTTEPIGSLLMNRWRGHMAGEESEGIAHNTEKYQEAKGPGGSVCQI